MKERWYKVIIKVETTLKRRCTTSKQRWFDNGQRCIDIASMSDTDIVSTLCNVENNADPTSKCWLGYLKKKRQLKGNFDTSYVNKVTDNKAFWKNIQTLFSEKRKFANKITLEDSEENILSDDTLVSDIRGTDQFFSKCNKNSKY